MSGSIIAKNDKKVENAWALFDWANSAYALVISTAVFPVYYVAMTPDLIPLFGGEISNTALYSFAVSFSYIIVALMSPILSGMADYGGRRLVFLKFFTTLGSLACMSLFFFKGLDQLWLGTIGFIVATIGWAGGIVFYNAYLPEIVTEDQYDRVSAKGFAWGYVGSMILLAIILVMVQKPEWFGFAEKSTLPSRIGFFLVGLWWLTFSQITFLRLPKDSAEKFPEGIMSKGFKEVKKTFVALQSQVNIKRFLYSFFFYSAGVQTVIYLATIFAEKELQLPTAELILVVLIIQAVGIVGAYFFAYLSKIRGNKFSIMAMLFIWIAICILAFFVQGSFNFKMLAGLVGLVMGGIQSLSRSTYSKLLEDTKGDVTSYFSFYDVLFKVSIVAGTFFFGLIEQITNNIRYSVLCLIFFFAIGIILLSLVNLKPSMATTASTKDK